MELNNRTMLRLTKSLKPTITMEQSAETALNEEQKWDRLNQIAKTLAFRMKGMNVTFWMNLRSQMIMSPDYDNIRSTAEFKDALWYVINVIDEWHSKRIASWIAYDYGTTWETKYLLRLLESMKVDDIEGFISSARVDELKIDLTVMINAQAMASAINAGS